MKNKRNDNHIAHNKQLFNNLTDLLERVINGECNDLIRETSRSSRTKDVSFSGTHKLEDALDIATGGWEAGRKIIGKYAKEYGYLWRKFFPKQEFGTKITESNTGDVVLIDKFIAGEPEDMMSFSFDHDNFKRVEENSNGRLQRIILNGTCSHYIRPETIYMYGALIAALVQTMEEAGFSVELVVLWKIASSGFLPNNEESPNDKNRLTYILRLKQFSENLDVDKLGFCIAHSSMLRRFIFSLMECEEDKAIIKNIINNSYGFPVNLTPDEITKFGGNNENGGEVKGNMYFRLLDSNYTLDQLVAQCTAVVKERFTEVSFNDGIEKAPRSFGGE